MISYLLLIGVSRPQVVRVQYVPDTGVAIFSSVQSNSSATKVGQVKLTNKKNGNVVGLKFVNFKPVVCIRWNRNDNVRVPEYAFYMVDLQRQRPMSRKIFSTIGHSTMLIPSLQSSIATFFVSEGMGEGYAPEYRVEVRLKDLKAKKFAPLEEVTGREVISAKGDVVRLLRFRQPSQSDLHRFIKPKSLVSKNGLHQWVDEQPKWQNGLKLEEITTKAHGNGDYETSLTYFISNQKRSVKVREAVSIQLSSDCNFMLLEGDNAHLVDLKTGKILWKKPSPANVQYWLK
jgi:hypothetical protein